jgi:hypothetical protein
LYLAPQRWDDAYRLFRWAAETYQWAGSGKIRQVRDPRVIPLGLVLAKEVGDRAVETRLREYVEASLEPHWDRSTGEFTWGFGLGEPVPRGQLNGVIMMAEVGEPGAWSRVFSPERQSYAPVGDPVNLASRIQDLTKEVGAEVLVSGETVRRLHDPVALEALPAVRVKGRSVEVEVYRAA